MQMYINTEYTECPKFFQPNFANVFYTCDEYVTPSRTVNCIPSTAFRQPRTVSRAPSAAHREVGTPHRHPILSTWVAIDRRIKELARGCGLDRTSPQQCWAVPVHALIIKVPSSVTTACTG
nr:PREDICTED: uncharacterized protein LOC105663249 [Megachile rotundata]